jgi:hypothetical protein
MIVVDGPADGAVTNGSVAVSGHIQGGTPPFQVSVLGVAASVNQAYFSIALTLVEGDQVVRIAATDASGRSASAQRSVSVDRTPPYLAITRPAANPAEASESPDLIPGTAGDIHLTSVTVAGQDAVVLGGQFSASVALQSGDNAIAVVARDLAGNTSQTTLQLHDEVVRTFHLTHERPRPARLDEGWTLDGHFTVRVNGSALLGGYYVAPGAQTVSFVARRGNARWPWDDQRSAERRCARSSGRLARRRERRRGR